MLTINSTAGVGSTTQINFTQGTQPIACSLTSGQTGITLDGSNRVLVSPAVPAGTYSAQVRCTNCSGASSNTLDVQIVVSPATTTKNCVNVPPPSGTNVLKAYNDPVKINLPDTFVGMHVDTQSYDWANGANGGAGVPVPAPGYQYDAIRSHDVSTAQGEIIGTWAQIERTQGQYDWSRLDAWANAPGNAGKPIVFTVYGPPAWHQKYPGEPSKYTSFPGIASPPKDAASVAAFVRAAKAKYGSRILAFEVGNEPTLPWNGQARWSPGFNNDTPFYSGTAGDYAEWVKGVVDGAGGTDVWAGAFVDVQNAGNDTLAPMMNAVASNGRSVKQMIQGFSFHWYNYDTKTSSDYISVVQQYKARLNELGVGSLPMINTEMGALSAIGAQTPSATDIKRWLAASALMDLDGVYLYRHSANATGGSQIGNPVGSTAVRDAINEIKTTLSGETICAGGITPSGQIWLLLPNGVSKTF